MLSDYDFLQTLLKAYSFARMIDMHTHDKDTPDIDGGPDQLFRKRMLM